MSLTTEDRDKLILRPLLMFSLYEFFKENNKYLPQKSKDIPETTMFPKFILCIKNKLYDIIKGVGWKIRKNKYSFSIKIENQLHYKVVRMIYSWRSYVKFFDEDLRKKLIGKLNIDDLFECIDGFRAKGFHGYYADDLRSIYFPLSYNLLNTHAQYFKKLQDLIYICQHIDNEAFLDKIISFNILIQSNVSFVATSFKSGIPEDFIDLMVNTTFTSVEKTPYGTITTNAMSRIIKNYLEPKPTIVENSSRDAIVKLKKIRNTLPLNELPLAEAIEEIFNLERLVENSTPSNVISEAVSGGGEILAGRQHVQDSGYIGLSDNRIGEAQTYSSIIFPPPTNQENSEVRSFTDQFEEIVNRSETVDIFDSVELPSPVISSITLIPRVSQPVPPTTSEPIILRRR